MTVSGTQMPARVSTGDRDAVLRQIRRPTVFGKLDDRIVSVVAGVVAARCWSQSVNQACIFRVVRVTKSLQDPLEMGNNLPGISDNVRE